MKNLLLLCRVIDNYGDIGFVYRLCRSLSQITENFNLTIATDNLGSFSKMNSAIDKNKTVQFFNGWKVMDWNNGEVCKKEISETLPDVVLECFQCGRPDWLEEIIFAKDFTKTVYCINVEYLTAEDWADDFHLLKSGTRSINIKKVNFMPGFSKKTAGLVIDKEFENSRNSKECALEKLKESGITYIQEFSDPDIFKIVLFSYNKNFKSLVESINKLSKTISKKVTVYSPSGMSFNSLTAAVKNTECTFTVRELPFLQQQQWDSLLTLSDFNMIRGEDSFARCCLIPSPFLWHVYVQDEEYQLVKAEAFLQKLEPFFKGRESLFEKYKKAMILYNINFDKQPGKEACEILEKYGLINEKNDEKLSGLLSELFESYKELKQCFEAFSSYMMELGDLAKKLADYIQCNCN